MRSIHSFRKKILSFQIPSWQVWSNGPVFLGEGRIVFRAVLHDSIIPESKFSDVELRDASLKSQKKKGTRTFRKKISCVVFAHFFRVAWSFPWRKLSWSNWNRLITRCWMNICVAYKNEDVFVSFFRLFKRMIPFIREYKFGVKKVRFLDFCFVRVCLYPLFQKRKLFKDLAFRWRQNLKIESDEWYC